MGQFRDETFISVTSLNIYQYHLMVNSTPNLIERNFVAGGRITGTLQNKVGNAQHASIRMAGKSRVFAGGTITAGDEFTSSASATAVAVASGDFVGGQAITSVASGGIFEAEMTMAGWKGQ